MAATNMKDAMRVLDPRPLEFGTEDDPRVSPAADSAFYMPLPVEGASTHGLLKPGPVGRIKQQLLDGGPETRCFLSGHVGSGKSTELNHLAVDKEITSQFAVVRLRLEEQEWAVLDAAQLFFRVAAALYEYGKGEKILSASGEWEKFLKVISGRIFEETSRTGVGVDQAGVSLEAGVAFAKIKGELKLSPRTRALFRTIGETEQSVLRDLIVNLVNDLDVGLARDTARADLRLLLIVDDLDKVRGAEAQKDIFDTHLNTLLTLPFCAIYTLPSGVAFGGSRGDLRRSYEHLHPVRVLRKCPESLDPMKALITDRIPYFVGLVRHRVEASLIDEEAVTWAAVHSGGVLRMFFYLLREGCNLASYNQRAKVDAEIMEEVVRDARRKESAGVHNDVREVLRQVHRTNRLNSEEDRRYLDQSRVLECYNGETWFEANPILWSLLGDEGQRDGQGH